MSYYLTSQVTVKNFVVKTLLMEIVIEEGIVSIRKEIDLYFLMKKIESFTDIFGKNYAC